MTHPLRDATPDDLAALHALIERAYRGDDARRGWTHEADLLDGQRTDRAALSAMLAEPDQLLLVHETAGTIDACVSLARRGDGIAYLGMLTVAPERQGGGMGRRLLAAAETVAAGRFGARSIEMTVIRQRAELIAWYERRGYRRTGERRPFPLDDPRFGLPRTRALEFVVLERMLGGGET